jgi:energy-coupling factor transporter ATP-binding protein EcfA2
MTTPLTPTARTSEAGLTGLPSRPRSIVETGLSQALIADMTLRTIYLAGELTGQALVDELLLPYEGVLEQVVAYLRRELLIEVKGASGVGEKAYRFQLTLKGSERAREATERSQYVGPAPVPLEAYTAMVARQQARPRYVDEAQLRQALGHLVLSTSLLQQIGPALNSGRSIFLYGPAGNGKTSIAEAAAGLSRDPVLIPHALIVGGQIIRLFDPIHHEPLPIDERNVAGYDRRWVLSRRPVVVAGGELNSAALDLVYDPAARLYEAPLQLKANTGVFLIDDFGRQQVRPQDLLNRWIVPLEKRLDYLTLHTGKQLEVPFEVLIVFSTNIAPRDLVDEAFLRRIRYKIEVRNPTPQEFREILRRVCVQAGITYDDAGLRYLLTEEYARRKLELRAVHPRDLVEQLIDIARFRGLAPSFSRELIAAACQSYFVDLAPHPS